MKNFLKIFGWLVGVVAVLVILAAIVLPLIVDPNDFRDDIAGAVQKKTGRELTIEGDLELSVIPWLGVSIGRTTLSDAPGRSDQPMLAIEGASVGVRLMALLQKRIEVSEVTLDGLRLNLYRGPEGANWDDLTTTAEAEPAATPEAEEQAFDMSEIGGIRLRDAQIRMEDAVENASVEAMLGEFDVGRITARNDVYGISGINVKAARVDYDGGASGHLKATLDALSAGEIQADPDAPTLVDISLDNAALDYSDGATISFVGQIGQLSAGTIVGDADAPQLDGLRIEKTTLDFKDATTAVKGTIGKLSAARIHGNAEAPLIENLQAEGIDLGYDGGEAGQYQIVAETVDTAQLKGGPGAPVIGKTAAGGISVKTTGADALEMSIGQFSTGGVVADAESPQVEGLELKSASIVMAQGESGTTEARIDQFTVGAIKAGSAAPIKGRIEGSYGVPKTDFSLDLDAKARVDTGGAVALSGLKADLGFKGEVIPGGEQSGRISANLIEVNNANQTLAVKAFVAELAGMVVRVAANGQQITDAPDIKGSVETSEFSPRELMQTLGIEAPMTADPAVLGKASFSTRFRLVDEKASLNGLKVMLDDTQLDGTLSVSGGDRMVARAKLKVDDIDLDRYLPPESDEATPQADTGPTEIPTEDLKAQDVRADLTVDAIKVGGLRMTGVKATALLRGGRLTIDPMTAGLYEGTLSGKAVLDARGPVPRLRLQQKLTGTQMKPLMTDLAEVDQLEGQANMRINVTAAGRTSDEMLGDLDGNVGFTVKNGILRGMNLTHSVQSALALIKRRRPPAKESNDTVFKQIKGTAKIADGVMTNDDLIASLTGMSVTGLGQIDLGKQVVDYDLTAAVAKGKQAENAGLQELAGKSIPIKISGNLADPSIKPDLGKIIGGEIESLLKKQLGLDKKKEPAEGGTEEEEEPKSIEDALKDLIGK